MNGKVLCQKNKDTEDLKLFTPRNNKLRAGKRKKFEVEITQKKHCHILNVRC